MASLVEQLQSLVLSPGELMDNNPNWDSNMIDDYLSISDNFNLVAQFVDSLVPIVGSGSPEGSVAANKSLMFIDQTGPVLYFNTAEGNTTGWTAV